MNLILKPKTEGYEDILATAHARNIWSENQPIIVRALEATSGLSFLQRTIHATSGVFNKVHSGYPRKLAMAIPLHVRYGEAPSSNVRYQNDLAFVGSLMHELGHHLLLEHGIIVPPGAAHDICAHQHLYLFLEDAWRAAYGPSIAEALKGYELDGNVHEDYLRSFAWAENLGKAKRQELLAYLREQKVLPAGAELL